MDMQIFFKHFFFFGGGGGGKYLKCSQHQIYCVVCPNPTKNAWLNIGCFLREFLGENTLLYFKRIYHKLYCDYRDAIERDVYMEGCYNYILNN